ncbi:MAG: anaerobic ribonucleoside-triphosphate reductase activating protein [Desulfobacterales bacterium]|nr:anaerobic ribonucleoside-triphosphate reductase activating protein [Desulfobacterales bacterium]MBS3756488.1 anaerobic ribonucleoside-triphosphate reductase activating protein [Desulfobacterales bacterium]
MRIGGLQKYSLIDYPPQISCVVFTAGCNFHCPYCHNPNLAAPGPDTQELSVDEIWQFLETRGKYLDAVVISGGEPTLHPDLADFCRQIRSRGFALKIDTNGSHPAVIRELIGRDLVNYIAMDIKTAPERYPTAISNGIDPDAIRQTVRIILDSGLSHEFRTTCAKPFTDAAAVAEMAELIRGAHLHAIQKPRTEHVLTPKFFKDHDRLHSDAELAHFRSIFAGTVSRAIIR